VPKLDYKTNMQFETITTHDLDKIRDIQPEDWTDIIPDISFYIRSSFCSPIKAQINGEIVGTGTSIVFDHTSWLAHIIVGREYRNRGIGLAIVNEHLESLRLNSIESCSLIATALGKPVYLKAGFRVVAEYSFFQREKPWRDTRISKKIIPFQEDFRSQIYELDEKISGEKREKLLTDFLSNSLLYIENNKVLGYYLPDLKEGLIFADTNEAGLELMKLKYSKVYKAVLPTDNKAGLEFLKQHGFIEIKQASRMILGNDIAWKPEKIYSRIGGNLG